MWIAEVAHQMALVPLVWLALRRLRGNQVDAAWWWLAAAFAVSWVADGVSGLLPERNRWIVSLVYPIVQTAIVAIVLIAREYAILFVGTLVAAATASALWMGVDGPDAVFRSVAWLAIVGIVWASPELPARLRVVLVVY